MARRCREETAPESGVTSKIHHEEDECIGLCAEERTRLIGDLCAFIRAGRVPEEMREAGLRLIGFLARRMPGEPAHAIGVREARRLRRP
jgi:hypothetical protein